MDSLRTKAALAIVSVSFLILFAQLGPVDVASATEFTVQSTVNCCFSSAKQVILDSGESTFLYTGGAWTNGYNRLNWFGFLAMEIPDLGISATLGTEEQIHFSSFDLALQAALGDAYTVVNDSGGPVAAYLFVSDGCPNFWCGDNWGTVTIDLIHSTVESSEESFEAVKARYR